MISELFAYFVAHRLHEKKFCELFTFVTPLHRLRLAVRENTRCNTNKRQPCLRERYRPIFGIVVFRREQCSNRGVGATRCGGATEDTCPAACASQRRQPSLLVMAHMRWLHGRSGHESTGFTLCVVLCVGGLQAWPIDTVHEVHGTRGVGGGPRGNHFNHRHTPHVVAAAP